VKPGKKSVQVTLTMVEARELHLSLELLDALTNTTRYDKSVKLPANVKHDLEVIRGPFKALREALDTIMHDEGGVQK